MTTGTLPHRAPVRTAPARFTLVDKYLLWLCLALLGYALDGRGFAYFFMGEMALVAGGLLLVNTRGWTVVFQSPQLLLLLPFWGWGLARTIPYLQTYRVDAVRDAMLWGYSAIAVIVAGLVITYPRQLLVLLHRYRRFAYIFLAIIPFVFAAFRALGRGAPVWPVLGVPIIHEKEGDIMVHLAGIFAFWIAGLDGKVRPLWIVLLTANAAVIGVVDRAGMLAFLAVFFVCGVCRPRHPIIWRICAAAAFVVFVLWVTDIHIPMVKGREISFNQIVTNVGSMTRDTGSEGLDSTKEWRVDWWRKIRHYTIYGPYRWTGKGFGVNLAEDDGFQVLQDNSLRAPHNAHMDFLAREGVTGVIIWAVLQLAWGLAVGAGYLKSRIKDDARWQAVFLFLFCSWMAFVINSSFDVYLEGPMGAMWFWTVFGVGAAAVHLYKRRPEILYVT